MISLEIINVSFVVHQGISHSSFKSYPKPKKDSSLIFLFYIHRKTKNRNNWPLHPLHQWTPENLKTTLWRDQVTSSLNFANVWKVDVQFFRPETNMDRVICWCNMGNIVLGITSRKYEETNFSYLTHCKIMLFILYLLCYSH